ncbi:MAG: Flp family type IVb pilin [Pseudolabrys sp.]|nr:Flp family type IVb pilin [Pseudolabrys sp.]MDP2295485.1 Flp family type IVb pilin [Pseudolabrys sp.]
MSRAAIIRRLRHLLRDPTAATSIEYAIIAGGIAAVLVGVISTLGGNVSTLWTTVKDALN